MSSLYEHYPIAMWIIDGVLWAIGLLCQIVAFIGVENVRLEMLFLAPKEIGKGIGRKLVQYGLELYGVREVTVNEQNPDAVGFYEHLGFATYKRTDLDEEGNPYPLLYMRSEERERGE